MIYFLSIYPSFTLPHSPNKENAPEATKWPARHCIPSVRLADAMNNANKAQHIKQVKMHATKVLTLKKSSSTWTIAKKFVNWKVDLFHLFFVVCNFTERVYFAEAERNTAEHKLAHEDPAEVDTIPCPVNLGSVTIESIQQQLNLDGDANKAEWLDLRINLSCFMRVIKPIS